MDKEHIVTEMVSREERNCPAPKESMLTVSWPWVLGGFTSLIVLLVTILLSTAISQEHRLTTAEQQQISMEKQYITQQKAWVDAVARVERKVDKIADDQSDFLKEFYRKIK